MANFGPLAAEIVSLVWGTQANFNGFRVLAALLHSQTAALNIESATCIRQGSHHVGHWPTFLGFFSKKRVPFCNSVNLLTDFNGIWCGKS